MNVIPARPAARFQPRNLSSHGLCGDTAAYVSEEVQELTDLGILLASRQCGGQGEERHRRLLMPPPLLSP